MKRIAIMLLTIVFFLLAFVCFTACANAYTVTFVDDDTTLATMPVPKGKKAYPVALDLEEGVYVEGWYLSSDLNGTPYSFDTAVTDDITLYAKLQSNLYTVTYVLNGGKDAVPTQESVNANGSFTVTDTMPIWIGYEFKGWSDGTDLYQSGDEYTVNGTDSVVLTAKWEYKTVHISFYDGDGVKMESFEKDLPYGSDVVAPDSQVVPTPNFCFVNNGWQDAEGEEISLKNIIKDTDFYAAYDYVPSDLSLFKFTLNDDGESYSIAVKDKTLSGKIALPETYNGLYITTIAVKGFYGCRQMKAIYIPSSYRIIKAEGFSSTGLTQVYIAEGLTTIEAFAFRNIGILTIFELPASVNDIHWVGFAEMNTLKLMQFDWLPQNQKDALLNFEFTTSENGFYTWDHDDKVLYGEIGKKAVFASPSVTELVFNETVEEIYPYLCYYYSQLNTVTIKAHNVEIGPSAFFYCSTLTEVSIEGSINKIWGSEYKEFDGVTNVTECKGAFLGVSIETFNFPSGLEYIGEGVFFFCWQLTQITIPNTIQYISEQAFDNSDTYIYCNGGITQIIIEGENDYYYVDGNKALIEKGTGVNSGDTLLYYCMNASGSEYSIPNGVTSLTPYAFAFSVNLTMLTIPEGVTEIPTAFAQFSKELTTVIISSTVEKITWSLPGTECRWGGVNIIGSYGAFLRCEKLTEISFTSNSKLATIEQNSFNNIGCTSLNLPASVKTIFPYAIYGEKLTEITVEDSLNAYYCDVNGVLFTADMKMLVAYPSGNTAIEYNIPEGVEEIGEVAFNSCIYIEKIIMPDSVKIIGKNSFINCYTATYDKETKKILTESGLTEVIMSSALEKIEINAFYGCKCLTKITFTGTVPQLIKDYEENTRCIFGYYYRGNYILFDNLKFEVPSKYIIDYYQAWFDYCPNYVDGFDSAFLPEITYHFDAKGGSLVSDILGVIVEEMPIPVLENYYFCGWYSSDGTLNDNQWSEQDKIVFPYIYKSGDNITLYAKWSSEKLQNGQKDIWAYNLNSNTYIRAEIKASSHTWFAYTPQTDCIVSLNEFEMINSYYYYCFNTSGVDINKDGWEENIVYTDDFNHYVLTAGVTYYFMMINNDDTDYVVYAKINLFNETGERVYEIMNIAIFPSKYDF